MRSLIVATSLSLLVALGCASGSRGGAAPEAGARTPIASGATATATTPSKAATTATPETTLARTSFHLNVVSPAEEMVVMVPSVEIRGNTVLEAVVTINGKAMPVDASGGFSANLELEPGPNTITVVASDFQGNEQARILTVIYVP